jgi:hypothetical protein
MIFQKNWSATFEFLRRHKYLPSLAVGCLFAFAYWESTAPERLREENRKEKESVGAVASVAGNIWASAYLACRRIGVADVNKCAEWKGPLIDDAAAATLADAAVRRRTSFDALCTKHHDPQYCYQLLNRAFQLALTRPAGQE